MLVVRKEQSIVLCGCMNLVVKKNLYVLVSLNDHLKQLERRVKEKTIIEATK